GWVRARRRREARNGRRLNWFGFARPAREIVFDRRLTVDFVGINVGVMEGGTPVGLIELDGFNARRNRYGTCKSFLSMGRGIELAGAFGAARWSPGFIAIVTWE
ncbi:hypothetical protein K0M31_005612, partial [Melipona bicolor]